MMLILTVITLKKLQLNQLELNFKYLFHKIPIC